jgi:GAF domain-containing protein
VVSVDGERQDALVRLGTTTTAVRRLVDIAAELPLDDVMAQVAAAAAQALPVADAVTVTVLSESGASTAAWTEEDVLDLDTQQYAADRGPCLDAARTNEPVRAVIGARRDAWPEFTAAAERAGVSAHLSVPLLLEGTGNEPRPLASFNVYSRTAAFDAFDEGLLLLFAATAAVAVGNARTSSANRATISQLNTALTSRHEIDQAKGILMALHGCTADEAFRHLITHSQHNNTKLHTVARDLLTSVATRDDSTSNSST